MSLVKHVWTEIEKPKKLAKRNKKIKELEKKVKELRKVVWRIK